MCRSSARRAPTSARWHATSAPLRRTRVGGFGLDRARTLEQLEESFDLVPLAAAVAAQFPRVDVDDSQAATVLHGGRLPTDLEHGPVGVFAPDGRCLSLAEPTAGALKPLVVFS